MEHRLVTQRQLVHHHPSFPESFNRSHTASLCLWGSVFAESALDIHEDVGVCENKIGIFCTASSLLGPYILPWTRHKRQSNGLSTLCTHTDGLLEVLPLQTATVNEMHVPSMNWWFTGKKLPYFWLNCCCTVKTDSVSWNGNTRTNFYRPDAVLPKAYCRMPSGQNPQLAPISRQIKTSQNTYFEPVPKTSYEKWNMNIEKIIYGRPA